MVEKRNSKKTFPKDEEKKLRSKIRNLRDQNKKYEAQIKRLKEENKQYQEAIHTNFEQIKDLVEHVPLEEILRLSRDNKMGKAKKRVTPKTQAETRKKFKDMMKGKKDE